MEEAVLIVSFPSWDSGIPPFEGKIARMVKGWLAEMGCKGLHQLSWSESSRKGSILRGRKQMLDVEVISHNSVMLTLSVKRREKCYCLGLILDYGYIAKDGLVVALEVKPKPKPKPKLVLKPKPRRDPVDISALMAQATQENLARLARETGVLLSFSDLSPSKYTADEILALVLLTAHLKGAPAGEYHLSLTDIPPSHSIVTKSQPIKLSGTYPKRGEFRVQVFHSKAGCEEYLLRVPPGKGATEQVLRLFGCTYFRPKAAKERLLLIAQKRGNGKARLVPVRKNLGEAPRAPENPSCTRKSPPVQSAGRVPPDFEIWFEVPSIDKEKVLETVVFNNYNEGCGTLFIVWDLPGAPPRICRRDKDLRLHGEVDWSYEENAIMELISRLKAKHCASDKMALHLTGNYEFMWNGGGPVFTVDHQQGAFLLIRLQGPGDYHPWVWVEFGSKQKAEAIAVALG